MVNNLDLYIFFIFRLLVYLQLKDYFNHSSFVMTKAKIIVIAD